MSSPTTSQYVRGTGTDASAKCKLHYVVITAMSQTSIPTPLPFSPYVRTWQGIYSVPRLHSRSILPDLLHYQENLHLRDKKRFWSTTNGTTQHAHKYIRRCTRTCVRTHARTHARALEGVARPSNVGLYHRHLFYVYGLYIYVNSILQFSEHYLLEKPASVSETVTFMTFNFTHTHTHTHTRPHVHTNIRWSHI